MKEVEFKQLKVDDKFILNNQEYVRTEDNRISCCKVLNAKSVADSNVAIQVKPLTKVQVND